MTGRILLFRLSLIDRDFAHAHARLHLSAELRGKLRPYRSGGKDGIFPAVRPAFGSSRRFRVRDVLHQQSGPRALCRHSRSADGKTGKEAHEPAPSLIADLICWICPFTRFDATLKRMAF